MAFTGDHIDPELVPLVEDFPAIPLNAETLPGFRAAIGDMSALPDPASHPDVKIETVLAPRADGSGDIRCLVYRPTARQPTGALLHIHGGGFVMGLPEMDAMRNVALAQSTGCVILSVDYRLAPEHPHPAALEDCHAAAVWLAQNAEELGFPDERLGVIGESAGGGLAASLALLARDRGAPAFSCQVLIYPMIAPPGSQAPATLQDERIGQHIWTEDSNVFGWNALLGDGGGCAAMPAIRSTDLSALPPAFIAVGELDLFVHDNLAYASALLAAGTSVEAHLYPATFHGFDRADAAVSRRFTADLFGFVQRHAGG